MQLTIVPSLDGAYKRVERAGKHLLDLKPLIDDVIAEKRKGVVIERKPHLFTKPDGSQVMGVLGKLGFPFGPLPHDVSILIGECVYNLRAALDYLIYELALLDSRQIQDGTQFPIENSPKTFVTRCDEAKKRGVYVRGLSEEHKAAIKGLQPFDGCDWTGVLRDVSNPDKHRRLTAVGAPVLLSPVPGSTERIIAGETVDMDADVSILVVFREGLPVIETLEQLRSHVTQTLDAFKVEFKGEPISVDI